MAMSSEDRLRRHSSLDLRGEVAALTRSDLDPNGHGGSPVYLQAIIRALHEHLAKFVGPEPGALVFCGQSGEQRPDGAHGRGHSRTLEDLPSVSADTIGAGDGTPMARRS